MVLSNCVKKNFKRILIINPLSISLGGCPVKFEYIEYHRSITVEQAIEDLQYAAAKSERSHLRKNDYRALGKYSPDTICKKFGSWNNALEAAGLPLSRSQCKPRYKGVTRDELLIDLRRVAGEFGQKTVTSTDYGAVGLYNRDSFRREFGSWNKALEAADLLPTGFHRNIDKTELFANIEHLWIAKGRQPTVSDLQGNLSEYGPKAYFRVFGSWANALRTFAEYINHNDLADRGPSCFSEKTDSENASDSTITTDRMALGNDSVKHQTVRTIGDRLRFKVLLRDNFKCRICGASPATDPTVVLHGDHVFPWSEGGETTIDNLQTLCSKCNYGKSNLIV